MREPEAARPVAEHVHGVRDAVGRQRCRQPVRVLGGHVDVLGGVPDEERLRGRSDKRVQRGLSAQLWCRVLAEQDDRDGR